MFLGPDTWNFKGVPILIPSLIIVLYKKNISLPFLHSEICGFQRIHRSVYPVHTLAFFKNIFQSLFQTNICGLNGCWCKIVRPYPLIIVFIETTFLYQQRKMVMFIKGCGREYYGLGKSHQFSTSVFSVQIFVGF